MYRSKKILSYVFGGLAVLYGILLLFPQILFSNTLNHENFIVYYHSEKVDSDQLTSILNQSLNLLKNSDLFESKKKQKIFLCDGFGEFAFFALRSRKSFAVNYPLVQNVFISKSNILENTIERNGAENNIRTLSGVIAHETTHSILEDRLGFLKYKLLPSWKNEGYCDYVAQESSYDEKLGWNQICRNKDNVISSSYTYFKYKTYVEHLLNEEKRTISDFLAQDFDLENLAIKSRKKYCLEP
ncbi:MAG: hypothetical protein AB8B59_05445 [Maribacter sp.]